MWKMGEERTKAGSRGGMSRPLSDVILLLHIDVLINTAQVNPMSWSNSFCLQVITEGKAYTPPWLLRLIAANIEYEAEDIMYDEARKKLRTAADGSLTTGYPRDRIFVRNSRSEEFVSAWSTQDEILGELKALRAENAQRDARDDALYDEFSRSEER